MYFLPFIPFFSKGVSYARLPPMCPGFESWLRRHMWVEFVDGSLPCSQRFFAGYFGFPLSLLLLFFLKRVKRNNDLEVAHPLGGSSSTLFVVELEFGNVGF